MTRNQTLQVTMAYNWRDPIGLWQPTQFRGETEHVVRTIQVS